MHVFAHFELAVVGVRKLDDFFVSERDKVAQKAQKHIQKSVFVYGKVGQPFDGVKLVGNYIPALLGLARQKIAVAREMLDRVLGNLLDLFNRNNLAVRADKLPLLAEGFSDVNKPLFNRVYPVLFDYAVCLNYLYLVV